jgi:uncharacterized spore protein YtfJ
VNPVAETLVEKALERLAKSADVRVVFGDPVIAGARTIVPVARVGYGFGGGLGRRPVTASATPETGGGGGGAVVARPVGVIEITYAGTRFIELDLARRLAGTFLTGVAVGLLLRRLLR